MSNCVKYMGLELQSPIIVSSCSLTTDPKKVKLMEEYGAGAVVLKSLFEEQISMDVDHLARSGDSHTEMGDYLHTYVRNNSIAQYKDTIRSLKATVKIPIIASINCYSAGEWENFAKEIEEAGADALEINIYDLNTDFNRKSNDIEAEQFVAIRRVLNSVTIPVSVKIGQHITNIPRFVKKLEDSGAKAVVMFNRFFAPDIDIKNFRLKPANPFSQNGEYREVLRWTALASSIVNHLEISTTTGIHTPETMIKMILAGAKTVQICSVIYEKGLGVIAEFNKALTEFLEENNYQNPDEMRGRLNYSTIENPAMYERVQFLRTFGSLEESIH